MHSTAAFSRLMSKTVSWARAIVKKGGWIRDTAEGLLVIHLYLMQILKLYLLSLNLNQLLITFLNYPLLYRRRHQKNLKVTNTG